MYTGTTVSRSKAPCNARQAQQIKQRLLTRGKVYCAAVKFIEVYYAAVKFIEVYYAAVKLIEVYYAAVKLIEVYFAAVKFIAQ